jgi:very-long-chain (3R)-3-hydroxyacyl-CoA dehydratase
MAIYGLVSHIHLNIQALSTVTTSTSAIPILVVSTISNALRSIYHSNELFSSVLVMSQCMALLEIVHALIGIVKSPVLVTAMQVMSRIVALVALYYSPNAQSTIWI